MPRFVSQNRSGIESQYVVHFFRSLVDSKQFRLTRYFQRNKGHKASYDNIMIG